MTVLLHAIRDGQAYRIGELFDIVHAELKRMAASQLQDESGSQKRRSASSLVNDAYLRLVGDGMQWDSRGHFFTAAATAMRRILIEGANRRRTLKHGGQHKQVPLPDVPGEERDLDQVDILALDEALKALKQLDARAEQVVMLRYFTGLTAEDTAAVLGVTSKTVQRDWERARHWLLTQIEGESEG